MSNTSQCNKKNPDCCTRVYRRYLSAELYCGRRGRSCSCFLAILWAVASHSSQKFIPLHVAHETVAGRPHSSSHLIRSVLEAILVFASLVTSPTWTVFFQKKKTPTKQQPNDPLMNPPSRFLIIKCLSTSDSLRRAGSYMMAATCQHGG